MSALDIPLPTMPVVTRAITDSATGYPAATWVMGAAHPLTADMKVVRLVVHWGESLEIYSVCGSDPNVCSRNTVLWPHVLLTEEVMDRPVFLLELAAAETETAAAPEESEEAAP